MATAGSSRAPPAPVPAAGPIAVLLVDDSAVMRAVIVRALEGCPDIRVAGEAASAAQALAMLERVGADLLVLDLEMPGEDGLAALPALVAAGGVPVLVVSAACGPDDAASAGALARGAAATLAKPAFLHEAGAFRAELLAAIRRLARPAIPALPAPAMVGVAGSTGGVPALRRFLRSLPVSFAAPVLVTQHLPPAFLPGLARELEEAGGRPVRLAGAGLLPRPGEVLLAPCHAHLALARAGGVVRVRLEEGEAPSGCRPSADPMFAALARLFGGGAAGVVLSGMGRDGAEGAARLAEAGGAVFVQDAASATVWGMPGAVARRGLARAVLPPEAIAAALAGGAVAGPAHRAGAGRPSGAMPTPA